MEQLNSSQHQPQPWRQRRACVRRAVNGLVTPDAVRCPWSHGRPTMYKQQQCGPQTWQPEGRPSWGQQRQFRPLPKACWRHVLWGRRLKDAGVCGQTRRCVRKQGKATKTNCTSSTHRRTRRSGGMRRSQGGGATKTHTREARGKHRTPQTQTGWHRFLLSAVGDMAATPGRLPF